MRPLFNRYVLVINAIALTLAGVALVDFILHPQAPDYQFNSTVYRAVVILVLTPLTLLVGFLIIKRVPGNLVGPLLIMYSGTVVYGSIRASIMPELFAFFYYYDMAFGWLGMFLLLLHFPDGKIYPLRIANLIYAVLVPEFIFVSLLFFSTATFQTPSQMANPFHVRGLEQHSDTVLLLGLLFISIILVWALVSPVLRYRNGSLRERQQIKWLALFGGSSVVYILLGLIVYPLLTGVEVMYIGDDAAALVIYTALNVFPALAIGIAVLRHRLWDIDLIIRRTLVYSILTTILTLIYFGGVVSLQELFKLITNQSQSPAATVLSTLASAALFNPIRRRIQTIIDRRFYRNKYNAERVLDAFSLTLRQEVDVDHLADSVLGVVKDTMQPTHVGLWLRDIDRHPANRQFDGDQSHR